MLRSTLRALPRSEQELVQEVEGIDRQIARGTVPGDRVSRSAVSFLKQLRRDRMERLARLRVDRRDRRFWQ
jgi:hypothetical protein